MCGLIRMERLSRTIIQSGRPRPAAMCWIIKPISSYSGGLLTGQVYSTVHASTLTTTSNQSVGTKLAALPQRALTKVACWLAPESAYAAESCGYRGGMFLGATVGLAIATRTPISTTAQVVGYLSGWAGWTDAMYSWLDCVTRAGAGQVRCAPGVVGPGCGSGGGGGNPF